MHFNTTVFIYILLLFLRVNATDIEDYDPQEEVIDSLEMAAAAVAAMRDTSHPDNDTVPSNPLVEKTQSVPADTAHNSESATRNSAIAGLNDIDYSIKKNKKYKMRALFSSVVPSRLKIGGLRLRILAFVVFSVMFFTAVLIVIIVISRRDKRRFVTTTRLSVVNKEVRIACNYIEKHYADSELNLKTICDELVTGEAFLEALFNTELGMSVEEFLTQVRINRAKILLSENQQLSPEELAARTGYGDAGRFKSDFFRIIGMPVEKF
jgi:AraC-like DNA-binding protein